MSSTGTGSSGVSDPGIRRPLDIDQLDSEASEFSWGRGLEPQGREDAPPTQGGMYRGTTPAPDVHIGVSR
ncbi:hypothetical protein [Mycolicibacterium sp.]|uniref:hypothetical protein n=1 Tax=Mycolicibacterium sp. TaxID=2320850 RepID=UPI0037CA8664